MNETRTAADTEITFQVAEFVFVTEYAARDLMHPSRTVNTTTLVDLRGETARELVMGTDGFAHGVTLTQNAADAKFLRYEEIKDRPFRTPAQRRTDRRAAL
jgi:hypothetical protein